MTFAGFRLFLPACAALFACGLAVAGDAGGAGSVPIRRFINVVWDRNVYTPYNGNFPTDSVYIIDADETKGYAEFFFADDASGLSAPKKMSLLLNTADIAGAESADGFTVFCDGKKAGFANNAPRAGFVEVPLDMSVFKDLSYFSLFVRANGNDGLYVLSRRSGFGAVLIKTY